MSRKTEILNDSPVIRIKKIVIDNFKCVEHGEVVFNCGKEFVPYGTECDILGIYGQNGSGKTTVLEAIKMFKTLLKGMPLRNNFANLVANGNDKCSLRIFLDLQYSNGDLGDAVYEITVSKSHEYFDYRFEEDSEFESIEQDMIMKKSSSSPRTNAKSHRDIVIESERVLAGGTFNGLKMKLQPIIEVNPTDSTGKYFSPKTKIKDFFTTDELYMHFVSNVSGSPKQNVSYIFSSFSMELFCMNKNNSLFYDIIKQLHDYAANKLFVGIVTPSVLDQQEEAIPFYTQDGMYLIPLRKPKEFSQSQYINIRKNIEPMNYVLQQIVPGLCIDYNIVKSDKATGSKFINFVSIRDDMRIPLQQESAGIIRIIQMLNLIIAAYNDFSVTVAIDEFDAGIFEYLLGEILQIFEETGRGQLIFTSHNLRPLEIIDKKFICFTTTNPQNRYIHLKNIGATNNLRSTYFREIILGNQDENLYNKSKKHRIVAAFNKAKMLSVEGRETK